MQRYFLSELNHEITGQDAHHITKVMRMTSGQDVIICVLNRCYTVELDIKDSRVFYRMKNELPREKNVHITLIQGLPKHPKTELVAKYATLFGASKIVFIPMNRSIAKLDNEANKLKRMELIAKEAAELSHRFDVPEISFIQNLKHIDWKQFSSIVVADENEKTMTLPLALPHIQDNDRIALVIGPEGGLSEQERAYFDLLQAKMVSLGKRILPTELASLYALTYFSLKNV